MQALNSYRLLFILAYITSILLSSCTDAEKQTKNNLKRRYAVDLFSEELAQENGKIVYPMTYKEAVDKSILTLRVSELILVDKSASRGNKPLYLYKIRSGKAIKPAKGYKQKYPVYFIAYKDLFAAKSINDAVFVFLENIQNHKILTRQRNMKYQWVHDAPEMIIKSQPTKLHSSVDQKPTSFKKNQQASTPSKMSLEQRPNLGRPDADKKLTWAEANDWYRHGHGQPLTVDLSKINFQGVSVANFPRGINSKELIHLSALNDALVYGAISLRYLGDGKVVATESDTYHFDPKPCNNLKNAFMNFKTSLKKMYTGKGQPFKIHFEGEGKIGKKRK